MERVTLFAVVEGQSESGFFKPFLAEHLALRGIDLHVPVIGRGSANARGVLHRDINANNVLIDEHGAVTLLDFGCADLGEIFYNAPAGERRYMTPPEARVVLPDAGIGARRRPGRSVTRPPPR